jgi:endonuclease I
MAKRNIFLGLLLFVSGTLFSQIPNGYYNSAEGLYGTALKQALHDIIDNHTSVTYQSLWTYFQSTDKKSNGKVWDMYSDVPGGTPAYEFTFVTDQCGSYNSEGDCYNREHSFPSSWFDDAYPMYSDLFQLVPTDGYVNNRRSNYPYGKVGSATWTSTNGSKLGSSATAGYSGTVFEPIDAYKGDFARNYFYMATRYYNEDSGWPGSDMVTGSQPKPWAVALLLQWHESDPVSQKEIDRNNAVYSIQHNRNPFIDHPEYAENIWSPNSIADEATEAQYRLSVYPNPASGRCFVDVPTGIDANKAVMTLYSVTGQKSGVPLTVNGKTMKIDLSGLVPGLYFVTLTEGADNPRYRGKLLVR